MARGAVVVILSDGWERGDPALVGREMERLRRLAHRIVWVNPRKASRGVRARWRAAWPRRCPRATSSVSGHNLRALDAVDDAIAGDDATGGRDEVRELLHGRGAVGRGLGAHCSTSSASRPACREPRCSSAPATTPTRSRSRSSVGPMSMTYRGEVEIVDATTQDAHGRRCSAKAKEARGQGTADATRARCRSPTSRRHPRGRS